MKKFQEFDTELENERSIEPQSMSLMGGIAGGAALPGPEQFGSDEAADKRRMTQQSFLIGGIVTVVAFGALMGMRLTQGEIAVAVSKDTKQFMDNVEVRLKALDGSQNDALSSDAIAGLFRDTRDIVAALEDDPTRKQVPVDQVRINPFTPLFVAALPIDQSGKLAEAERTRKLNGFYGELARIKVQSLVGGARPRAFIGDELYKVGDTVGSFVITEIDNRTVSFTVPDFELRDGDAAFVLGMGQGG